MKQEVKLHSIEAVNDMILRYSRLHRRVQYESVSLTNPLKHLLTRQVLSSNLGAKCVFGPNGPRINMKAPLKSAGGPVQKLVAFPAKRDQVGLCIVTKSAAQSQVVNIEILRASTFLTAPTITLQDFSTQPDIQLGRLSNSRPFLRSGIIHGACFL